MYRYKTLRLQNQIQLYNLALPERVNFHAQERISIQEKHAFKVLYIKVEN